MSTENDELQVGKGPERTQALAETSLELLRQVSEGGDSPVQLDSGLQLLLQLQSQRLGSKAKHSSSSTCCIGLFIETQVSRPSQVAFCTHNMLPIFGPCAQLNDGRS